MGRWREGKCICREGAWHGIRSFPRGSREGERDGGLGLALCGDSFVLGTLFLLLEARKTVARFVSLGMTALRTGYSLALWPARTATSLDLVNVGL